MSVRSVRSVPSEARARAAPESAVQLRGDPTQSELGRYLADVSRVPLLTRDDERALGEQIEAGERAALEATLSCAAGRTALARIARALELGRMRFADVVCSGPSGGDPQRAGASLARVLRRAARAGDAPALERLVRLRLTRVAFDRLRRGIAAFRRTLPTERRHELDAPLDTVRRGIAASDRAKARFVEANLRLVVSVAKKHKTSKMALSDLVQEGNLGLLRAVDKFDYRRGYKFSTYATWWIRQHIHRGFIERGSTIRLPVHVVETKSRVERAAHAMHVRAGRAATADELAAECALPLDTVQQVLRLPAEPASLDTPVFHDATATLFDRLSSDELSPYERVVERQLHDDVGKLLRLLRAKPRQVLELRFGIVDGRPRTLAEVGEALGVTRERVRQLEKQALTHLRRVSVSPSRVATPPLTRRRAGG